ncbi:helix-turn-helix domain-containing protein [Acidiphilium rubrum]|uniref:helix-turn-helix domain-containing protein n=1 Tax=Acidiphilium rubrum TaxID=526 RepID=UPI002BE1B530|nr:helix-turn-helix domain-containing protein [Acidiphilium rubrum]HQT86800.1 helix-turn-helix domain-containing protein [Acidiphilium rubrum]
MHPRFLRISDAVTYSGKSRTALYLAMARGEIIARKSGKVTLIDRESLDRHLENLPRADIRLPSAHAA